jgi:hypothetical protein
MSDLSDPAFARRAMRCNRYHNLKNAGKRASITMRSHRQKPCVYTGRHPAFTRRAIRYRRCRGLKNTKHDASITRRLGSFTRAKLPEIWATIVFVIRALSRSF